MNGTKSKVDSLMLTVHTGCKLNQNIFRANSQNSLITLLANSETLS
jgi:hypothetical protein